MMKGSRSGHYRQIVTNVPSLATRREHLTQSVVGTFVPYPKIRARGQMSQLEIPALCGRIGALDGNLAIPVEQEASG